MYNGKWEKIKIRKIIILIALSFLFSNCTNSENIKYPAVNGAFYPDNPDELNKMVSNFINNADVNTINNIMGIVVPHAGYIFSGDVAGYSFKALKLSKSNYDYIIILGTSHYSPEYGLLTCSYSKYKVPTGEVKIAKNIIKNLVKKTDLIKIKNSAYLKEHSIEVELPFILKIIKNPVIIPFVVSNISIDDAKKVAGIIYNELKNKKILVIISTDLSHYPPYDIAKKVDRKYINSVLTMDSYKIQSTYDSLIDKYFKYNLQTAACGNKAVICGIEILKKFGVKKAKLLYYKNSGDVMNKDRVVGYASIVFYNKKIGGDTMSELDIHLDEKTKKRMLEIAREAIKHYLDTGEILKVNDPDEIFDKKYGIFVTLKKHGELRGCIGVTEAIFPLREGIPQYACHAAFDDPRFSPVKKEELKDIDIEISILSHPKKINSVDEIEMGKHGVIIKKGARAGLFLPQVATETGWSKEEFLSQLCWQKAGLPPDAWKTDKDIEMYIFTVYAFSENDEK